MKEFGIELIDTGFSYGVGYRGHVYAHDLDSDSRRDLQIGIAKFQRIPGRLPRLGRPSRSPSKILNALNPFNYVGMGRHIRPLGTNYSAACHSGPIPDTLLRTFRLRQSSCLGRTRHGRSRSFLHPRVTDLRGSQGGEG